MALYNYAAQHDDELTFAKASVINVLDRSDSDWWKGELNGVCGVFPVNYVAPLAEAFQGAAGGAAAAAGGSDGAGSCKYRYLYIKCCSCKPGRKRKWALVIYMHRPMLDTCRYFLSWSSLYHLSTDRCVLLLA